MASDLLAVIDYQNDFIIGTLGYDGAKETEDAVCEKINSYLRSGHDVVFTLDTHEQKYLFTEEGKHLPVKHCLKNSVGHRLYGKVAALAEGRECFDKPAYASAELAQYIRDRAYKSVELIGAGNDLAILSNAVVIRSFSPDCRISVDTSCIAAKDGETFMRSVELMRKLFIEVK